MTNPYGWSPIDGEDAARLLDILRSRRGIRRVTYLSDRDSTRGSCWHDGVAIDDDLDDVLQGLPGSRRVGLNREGSRIFEVLAKCSAIVEEARMFWWVALIEDGSAAYVDGHLETEKHDEMTEVIRSRCTLSADSWGQLTGSTDGLAPGAVYSMTSGDPALIVDRRSSAPALRTGARRCVQVGDRIVLAGAIGVPVGVALSPTSMELGAGAHLMRVVDSRTIAFCDRVIRRPSVVDLFHHVPSLRRDALLAQIPESQRAKIARAGAR